ncbi:MAG: hypothetical protein NTZ83_05370 [Candidatus Pacearchaeota archaeon]|nr:hypothetical protein [Candidatus Pacearchaeota archaeon]
MSDYELKRNVCDSLLLNFDKVLKISGDREFTIPSHQNCEEIFIRALREIYGKDLHTEYLSPYVLRLRESKKINPKISDTIYRSFSGDRDYQNFFQDYLSGGSETFDSEFFMWFGTYCRYYPKEREKALKNIGAFFKESELKDLNKIGNLIKKHTDIWWEEKLKNLEKFWS